MYIFFFFFISQSSSVYVRLEEASAPQHLVSLTDINMALRIRLKQSGKPERPPQSLMCLSAGNNRDRIRAEISGLRRTHSFVFMPFLNLPIYFSGVPSPLHCD